VKCAVVIAVLLYGTGVAAAQNGTQSGAAPAAKSAKAAHGAKEQRPLPVVIPQQFAPPQEVYASFPESPATAEQAKPSACQAGLAKLATFQPLPVLVGAGECGATDAVLMDNILMPDQSKIAVTPPATMRCPMAAEIARWVREDVAPSLAKFGAPLRILDNFDSYSCRGRNRVRGAQLSEHGKADALDVRAFKLADGRDLNLTDVNVDKDWREAIRTSVCTRFSTVLGPGSDGYHEQHIHLDLAERHNNYKVCEWDVREPPPPVEARATTTSADAAPAGDDTALIPLGEVPLPRPRPVAQIERVLQQKF
jgi:hypothetical protein